MKKILSIILLVVSVNGLSQTGFPGTQSMANASTKLLVNGGLQAVRGIINGVFTDTTAANSDYIDFYNGAQIYTRSDRNFWLRDSVLNMWIRMAKYSEAGVSNIYNTSGILTANRTLTGLNNTYSLFLDSLNTFRAGRNGQSRLYFNSTTSGIISQNGSAAFTAGPASAIMNFSTNALTQVNDSTTSVRIIAYETSVSNGLLTDRALTPKNYVDSLVAAGGGGSSFSYDSLSMISITSYPGVSVQWTTGTITSGSPTLTVASAKDFAIGQWVTVEGAGAAGVNLRTTITNVAGTTITLNNNAGTSVTNARFRHDCTVGIQAALADAIANPRKSTLYVPADTATYVISGPLVTSVDGINPNAQLYIPLVVASNKMVTVRILGSTPPNMASEGTVSAPRNSQGCIFESTLTSEASGTDPAVLGTSYSTISFPSNRNYINAIIENLIIRTATKNPAGTDIGGTMSGINWKHMTQKHWNNLKIDISSALVDRAAFTNFTFGLYSPEVNNKAELDNGKIYVEGYYYGHAPGEHELTSHYISLANHIGIIVLNNYYQIFYTKLTAELNSINIQLQGTSHIGISSYDTEHGTSGIGFPFEADIKQVSGSSTVNIWQSVVSQSGTGPGPGITIIPSGNPNYTIEHGDGQNRWMAKIVDITVFPTDSLTGYWPLENESGDFPDSTGNGFDLTRVNGTTTVDSKVDRGANFVSSSSQALSGTADNRLSASASGLTIGGWFRIATGTTGLRALFSKWGAGQAEWAIYWSSSNNAVHFAASNDGTAFVDVFNVSGTIAADDSWHFLVGLWDGVDIKIYIDNVEWATGALATMYAGTANIGVGNYPFGAGTTFDGGADELFVYRKALSDEQLTFLYNSGVGVHYLKGANYSIIDTTSSRLILNELKLTSKEGIDSSIAFFDQYGEFQRGMTFDDFRNSISGAVDTSVAIAGSVSTNLRLQKIADSLVSLSKLLKPSLNKGIFIASPTSADVIDVWQTPVAITITSLKAILRGTTPSVTYNIRFGTDITSATTVFSADITCTSVTTGCSNSSGFNDATIPAGSFIWIFTSAASGTINSIGLTINYTED